MNSAQQRKHRRAFRQLEHSVLIDAKKHRDAGAWCQQQFGKRWEAIGKNTDGAWCMFWAGQDNHDKYIFHFVEERDKLIFSLKWL